MRFISKCTAVDKVERPSKSSNSYYLPLSTFNSVANLLGTKLTSAPVSSNMGTSVRVDPPLGSRSVTCATGAGGAKRIASYDGIGGLSHNFHCEVRCVRRVLQTRTNYLRRWFCAEIRNDNVNLCAIRQTNVRLQFNLAAVHDFFDR